MTAHVLQFAFITLISSLAYHALREDSVARATAVGLRRFGSFMLMAGGFGFVLFLIARWL